MFQRKARRSKEFRKNSQVIDIREVREERKKKRKFTVKKKQNKSKIKAVVTERQAGKKARRRSVYFVVFLVVLGLAGGSIFNILALEKEKGKILDEQQRLLDKKTKLEIEWSQVNEPEYIEQQARDQLQMIRNGEVLYVVPEKEEKTTQGIVPE